MLRTPATELLHNRHLLILVILLIVVAGLAAWSSLPRIEDPRITTRNALVITTLPGADAARVEALVTRKLEDALRQIAEIKTIESTSRSGISVLAVELDDHVDGSRNEQVYSIIRDKLADAEGLLPSGAGKPRLDDKRGAVAYSLVAAVSWIAPTEPRLGILGRLAEELGDRLRNLPGTEQLVLFGAPKEEMRVTVDPGELAALGLSPWTVAKRLAAADPQRPAGSLHAGARQTTLEVSGTLTDTARIAAIPLLAADGALVSVGDVAQVTRAWRDPHAEIAYADGGRAVLVAARTRAAVRLDDWAGSARQVVAELGAHVGDSVGVRISFDQSRYTDARLGALGLNLAAGAAVVVLVVMVAMGWRAALVVGSALPLSAGLTLLGLDLAGQRIHQMTIVGMVIAIGLLIDNAIVMTDEVRSRRGAGLTPAAAVESAARHLLVPLAASTFTTILGFMPIFLLPGNIGDFVRPIAVAVILALAASFAIAITIIPALAALLVPPHEPRGGWWRDGWSSRRLGTAYLATLSAALRRPWLTTAACLVLPVAGFVAAGTLGSQFFPAADRDQFEVQLWLAPGTSVRQTASTMLAVERRIRAAGDVRGATWVAGASSPPVYYNQLRTQDDNPSYARGTVLAASPAEAKRLVAGTQDLLSDAFPEARVVVRAFGQGPHIQAPVSMRLVGPDTERLRAYGEELRRIMQELPEITHTLASIQGGEPKLWLEADEADARLAGLSLGQIAGQFQTALEGAVGGRVLEDLEDLPIRVRNGERINTVEAWLRPGVLPIDVTRAVQQRARAADFHLAPGYRLDLAGDSKEQRDAMGLLLAYAPLLATLMLASLVLSFRSFRLAGLIGVVAVLSVGLGLLSLWAGAYPLGFNPILGSAGLAGVAINASIIVLAAIRAIPQARAGEVGAIVQATLGSTRHIVATTLTTVGGFLPLIFYSGGDFWPPLAVVIAGGVALSTTLGLLLTPAVYRLLARREPDAAQAGEVRSALA